MNRSLERFLLAAAIALAAACTSSPSGTTGGGATTGGTSGSTTSGGTTSGSSTTFPCTGRSEYQPTNPPTGQANCWCNPKTNDHILNGCTANTPNLTIPQPPPAGSESLPLYDGGTFPLPAP